ncbi:helix-turn-helix domain-containing protein [Puia dinghuensis]|uniref:AraC family transcriptional regulator n=1 Tax=Puia dinghuensis TaxID=1792502 RepID=A0A8J2UE31_9BACT|nr:helix-turn-helix domain-containing protein [Puia dinghuensis]GGB03628.1 AraC family transcriptional regulator [Puia dinghuensis]
MKHYKTLVSVLTDNGWAPPEHPLFSAVRCNHACTLGDREFTSDFYMIGFKKLKSGVIRYGRTKYDHENGSMSFFRPRQLIEFRDLELEEDGFLIFFHEDYLNGHPLHSEIKKYGFFDYESNEALHLSPKEERTIWELFDKIQSEYTNNPDEYSREIILTHIDSILKYSQRFYKRQFLNRNILTSATVSKFNQQLSDYFERGLLETQGLPTVNYMASTLHLSPRYLSDLLKEETGKTAIEHIHIFLISEAKNLLKGPDYTVSETAYKLGFENLPYFSRLFKKEVGLSPNQFKKQALN